MIKVKRAYEEATEADGARILVDRLWPRGLATGSARIELWMKDLAPSHELRRWFGHSPERWQEFKARYRRELIESGGTARLQELAQRAKSETITLVFAAKDETYNNAQALKELIETIQANPDLS
ncbi:MAG: DUF488 family protein [Chloroflexi bacterium]|nr:DUF488 family protein [Chloroflexota bacterium]